jgi:hypothetical protein
MVFIYQSILGNKGRIEIDLNYIFRISLWNVEWRSSPHWIKSVEMGILKIHELSAGKLHALLGREASRDLFDSHQLLTTWPLDQKKLKLAFTVYAGMERDNWRRISTDNIQFTVKDIRDKLIPVLKTKEVPGTLSKDIKSWGENLVEKCKIGLSMILPFEEHEAEFLERLQKYGEIRPDLISDDEEFCQRVVQHPSLIWRARRK